MKSCFVSRRPGRALRFGFLVGIAVASALSSRGAVTFDRSFSPQQGLTAPIEQPWRQEICLNGSWQFQPLALPEDYDIRNGAPVLPEPTELGWSDTPIRIPSPWTVNAPTWGDAGGTYPSYPHEWEDCRMGWVRRDFAVPRAWAGKRIVLTFEGVLGYVQVFVNGQQVAAHFDNSLPLNVDVTEFVSFERENELRLGIRQASLFDVPGKYGKQTYPEGMPWSIRNVGVWQDVYLRALPALHVEDVVVRSLVDQGVLDLTITLRNKNPTTQAFRLGGQVRLWVSQSGSDPLSAPEPRSTLGDPVVVLDEAAGEVGPQSVTTLHLRQAIRGELDLWDLDHPNLYGLVLDVQQDGTTTDRAYQRFGWRQWDIEGRDVTLNGKVVQLKGDTAYLCGVSYLTSRYVWARYKAIKDVNGNAIRLQAMVRPRFYLDLADEMGIAVLEETEILGSTMDLNYDTPETWQRFAAHTDGMVVRDRSRPCVFGWSTSNEILSALWFRAVPRKLWPPVIDGIVGLADRIRALDPTRPWISSDGDGDFNGRLPTYVYHYGKPRDWVRDAPPDRPMGFGEAGSMVWGSPKVFSAYNGERAYESLEGMREGEAIEAYYYIVAQRKLAAYCSVFTIENLAFVPPALGMPHPEDLPGPDDGVVFGAFIEGQPGMQPERLLPFSTAYNPGYDPSLPLYETTPVFEAIRAGFDPEGPQPCAWDHFVESPPLPPPPKATIERTGFVGDAQGRLGQALRASGVPVATMASAEPMEMLTVDGATLTDEMLANAHGEMQQVLAGHGTVTVWAQPGNIDRINKLLPGPLAFVDQEATGLFADRQAPETRAIPLASLFFGNQSHRVIASHALAGPLVAQSRVLMETNNIPNVWPGRPSAAVLERHPVLIACETGGGRLVVTSLEPEFRSDRRRDLVRNVYANLGVALGAPDRSLDPGIDSMGYLDAALVLGSFHGGRYPAVMDEDFIGNESQANPEAGDLAGGRTWKEYPLYGDGIFDFFRMGLPGTEGNHARALGNALRPEALDANGYLEQSERLSDPLPGINAAAYVSFWLNTPRATGAAAGTLLTMVLTSDDGTIVWLDGERIHDERLVHGPGVNPPRAIPLELPAGWSHMLVKVGQFDGPWNFSARFQSPDTTLVEQLRASATKPR